MESLKMMPVRVRITSILKKAIYSGEYKSGDELSLTGIAEQLGISRTPVREAFQALEAEGLITLRMNKGAIVNAIDRKFVSDQFEMRILLESEAAARAAERGMETEPLLTQLYKLRDSGLKEVDSALYVKLNQEIHTGIWHAADNGKLLQYLQELWNGPSTGHSRPEQQLHYRDSTYEHISILESIRDRDAGGARDAMSRHISRSMENILKYYPEE
ncbi:MAG: GntR family transcriptional regulator [Lachnospiraceae bacterium]|nr:GntR family transcriptional regulator [Lachnospiraceae bacterium]